MKSHIVRLLLAILNSHWLNPSPCRYEFVGNVDAFSRSNIESMLKSRPDLTLREYLEEANRFKACPLKANLEVIEGGTVRDATVWDIHDLRNLKGIHDAD